MIHTKAVAKCIPHVLIPLIRLEYPTKKSMCTVYEYWETVGKSITIMDYYPGGPIQVTNSKLAITIIVLSLEMELPAGE